MEASVMVKSDGYPFISTGLICLCAVAVILGNPLEASGCWQDAGRVGAEHDQNAGASSLRSADENRAALAAVSQFVEEKFYDEKFNGQDWKKICSEVLPQVMAAGTLPELGDALNSALMQLQTSHTRFFHEQEVEYYYLLDIFSSGPSREKILERFPQGYVSYVGVGMFTERIDKVIFVTGVIEGGPAAKSGIRRGMRIVSVNSQPFQPIESFRGLQDREVTIEVQTSAAEDSRLLLQVVPCEIRPQDFLLEGMRASMRLVPIDGKQIGYVRIWSYAGEQFHRCLKEALFGGVLADADALVIDLRDGWGGASPEYLNLFNRQIPQLTMRNRTQNAIYFETQWRRPVALITNGGSKSGKELLAYGFRKFGLGPVVGERTGGAVVAGSPFLIGQDSVLYLAVTGIEVDGEVLEGQGVEPSIPVPYPLPYFLQPDPQIAAAVEAMSREIDRVRQESPQEKK